MGIFTGGNWGKGKQEINIFLQPLAGLKLFQNKESNYLITMIKIIMP